MRLHALLVFILVLCAPAVSAAGGKRSHAPKIGYIDIEDAYSGKLKLKAALRQAGTRASRIRPRGYVVTGDYDVIVIGSYVTSQRKMRRFLSKNRRRLAAFVAGGGVVVQFAQAWFDEVSPTWLPEGLSARRGDRDATVVRPTSFAVESGFRTDQSPVDLGDMDVYRGKRYYSTGIYGAVDLFAQTQGFVPLMADDSPWALPALLVGESGKGRVILAALSPDLSCVHGSSEVARGQACALLRDVLKAAVSPRLSTKQPSPGLFATKTGALNINVFLDANRNGRRESVEVGVPGAVVTHGYGDHVTNGAGDTSLETDPAFPKSLFLQVPDGHIPITAWHYPAADPGTIQFGIAPESDFQKQAAPIIVQLTDVHIGRNAGANTEARLLTRSIEQLNKRVSTSALWVFTGDITHTGDKDQLEEFGRAVAPLTHRALVTVGNHDVGLGPDKARRFRELIAPAFYTREWQGRLVVSVMKLDLPRKHLRWLNETIAKARLPVILLVHYYPQRKDLDRLKLANVELILSGHWHGDLVTRYKGVPSVNSPPALIGGWDFSPASARVISLGEHGPRTETVPFVRERRAVAVAVGKLRTLVNGVGYSPEKPDCRQAGSVVDLSPASVFSFRGQTAPDTEVQCTWDGDAVVPGGQVQWATNLPGRSLVARPIAYRGNILVPLRNKPDTLGAGALCSVEGKTGETRWCTETGAAATLSPVAVSGKVAITDVSGRALGLNAQTGDVIWTTDLAHHRPPRFTSHYIHTPGVRHRSTVYYCYQTGPFGLDIGSGKMVWTGGKYGSEDAFNHAKGVVVNSRLLCGSFQGGIFAFNLEKDEAKPTRLESGWKATATVVEDHTIWTLSRNRLARLDPHKGVLRGVNVPYAVLPPEPVFHKRHAVVRYGHDGLASLSLSSGKRRWKRTLPAGPIVFALNKHQSAGLIGTPALRGEELAVPGVDGVLRIVDVSDGKTRREYDLGVPLVSTPIFSKMGLFVTDYGGTLYRISD